MQIKKIPENYASLQGELIYTFADTNARTFDIRIIEPDSESLVAVKRLTGIAEGRIDIAPYLRRRLFFRPWSGPTGFFIGGARAITAVIEIDGIRSAPRMFIPGPEKVAPPMLITSCTGERIIGENECEELTFCTNDLIRVQVDATTANGDSRILYYTATRTGVISFRLNAADFPGVKTIRVYSPGTMPCYYIVQPESSGCRIAWRSRAGSIEHYTFPVCRTETDEVIKEAVNDQKGYLPVDIRMRRRATLFSAYEPSRMLNPLIEILASPNVWCVEEGIYHPVEVDNALSGVRAHGTLRNLELHIRFAPQITLP